MKESILPGKGERIPPQATNGIQSQHPSVPVPGWDRLPRGHRAGAAVGLRTPVSHQLVPSPGKRFCCLEKGWRGVAFFISFLEINTDCWDHGGELESSGMELVLCCSKFGCIHPPLATDLSWEASVPLESWKSLGLAEKVKEQLQSAADP